jgi:hypothetical protein
MREVALLLLTVSVAMLFDACTAQPIPRSAFLAGFSAADIIKGSYDQAGVQRQFKVSGGASSSKLGSRSIHHRDEIADLVINASDEPLFLSRIKGKMEEQLRNTGCKVFSEGSGDNNYTLEYTDGTVNGWIDIFGLRGQGDSYKLVIVITEN